jgi:hypothetical protein
MRSLASHCDTTINAEPAEFAERLMDSALT